MDLGVATVIVPVSAAARAGVPAPATSSAPPPVSARPAAVAWYLAGLQADGFHPPARALDAVAAEPAYELLEPVADEEAADDGAEDRDAECHVA